jgi:hypothetical protein
MGSEIVVYVPQLNFVFGLADRAGRRAVIALPRLRQWCVRPATLRQAPWPRPARTGQGKLCDL